MTMNQKHTGALNELKAVAWLLEQGYEVFRNVSQHGVIDLIAAKEGETVFIDVKSWQTSPRATPEQERFGVKFVFVGPGNEVRIADPVQFDRTGKCIVCGGSYRPRRRIQYFCGQSCKNHHNNAKARAGLPARVDADSHRLMAAQ